MPCPPRKKIKLSDSQWLENASTDEDENMDEDYGELEALSDSLVELVEDIQELIQRVRDALDSSHAFSITSFAGLPGVSGSSS